MRESVMNKLNSRKDPRFQGSYNVTFSYLEIPTTEKKNKLFYSPLQILTKCLMCTGSEKKLATQNVVTEVTALISHPTTDLWNMSLHFSKIPKWCVCTLKLENSWFKAQEMWRPRIRQKQIQPPFYQTHPFACRWYGFQMLPLHAPLSSDKGLIR